MRKLNKILLLTLLSLFSCSEASSSGSSLDENWLRDSATLLKDYYEKIALPSGIRFEDGSRPILEDTYLVNYYGEYRGSHVVSLYAYPNGNPSKFGTAWLGTTYCRIDSSHGVVFSGIAALPLVWNKGSYYYFEDAYRRGLLLPEDISAIQNHSRRADRFSNVLDIDRSASAGYKDEERDGEQTMGEEELTDPLNAARYGYYLAEKERYSGSSVIHFAIKDVYAQYDYGCFDGVYVAYITDFFTSYHFDTSGGFIKEEFHHGEDTIIFPNYVPSVWKDGTRYELAEALDQGILSENALPSIAAKAEDYLDGKTAIGYPSWWALPKE